MTKARPIPWKRRWFVVGNHPDVGGWAIWDDDAELLLAVVMERDTADHIVKLHNAWVGR